MLKIPTSLQGLRLPGEGASRAVRGGLFPVALAEGDAP
jgi:hypothetical protein